MTDATVAEDEALELARRLFRAVTAGDTAAVRALYAPDAVVWHNFDGVEQTAEQNLAQLAWIAAHVREFRYEDVRCQATATGFVQQHVTCGRAPDGTEFRAPACLVARVRGGRIARLDEYLDTAALRALLPA